MYYYQKGTIIGVIMFALGFIFIARILTLGSPNKKDEDGEIGLGV